MHPDSAAHDAASATLEPDIRRAEALLFELAAELRHVPLEERTRPLHLRALEWKRQVATWRAHPPPEDARRAAIDELIALGDAAREHRRRRRSGEVLLHARMKPRPA